MKIIFIINFYFIIILIFFVLIIYKAKEINLRKLKNRLNNLKFHYKIIFIYLFESCKITSFN